LRQHLSFGDMWSAHKHRPPEVNLTTNTPVYVGAGAIILFDIKPYVDEVAPRPTTFKLYTAANGVYSLYGDDGISQVYLEGEGTLTHILWDDKAKKLTIETAPGIGLRTRPINVFSKQRYYRQVR
jgi:alpha-glucosidase (family GH31 glycosyl hydrolase)